VVYYPRGRHQPGHETTERRQRLKQIELVSADAESEEYAAQIRAILARG
jgi:hypothetical protein